MRPASHFFLCENRKTVLKKKSVRKKCREETLGQVFSPAGKIPRLFQTADSHSNNNGSQGTQNT